MSVRDCRPYRAGQLHDFDPVSGWCAHGCGVRDDGRVINMHTGQPIANASERPATTPTTVEQPSPLPRSRPGLSQGHSGPYSRDVIDFTEPRRRDDT